MSRIVALILALGIFTIFPGNANTQYSSGEQKLDLQLRMLVDLPDEGRAALGKALKLSEGVEMADVLIKSYDVEITKASVEDLGGRVRSVSGYVMTAFVPTGELMSISDLPEVVAIEASKPMKYMMDTARSAANTDVASLQTAYDGRNVVVGAIDSGLDYEHSGYQ